MFKEKNARRKNHLCVKIINSINSRNQSSTSNWRLGNFHNDCKCNTETSKRKLCRNNRNQHNITHQQKIQIAETKQLKNHCFPKISPSPTTTETESPQLTNENYKDGSRHTHPDLEILRNSVFWNQKCKWL